MMASESQDGCWGSSLHVCDLGKQKDKARRDKGHLSPTWVSFFYFLFFIFILFFFLKSSSLIYLFNLILFFWLCWVFVSVQGLSLVVASGDHSSSRCVGLPPPRPLPLRSTGPRHAGSAVVAHGPSCSTACGILPDQGLNPCPLHWQADSQPLRHQGSPSFF